MVRPADESTAMRLILRPSWAEANEASIESVGFWIYIPSTTYKINLYTYDAYDPANATTTDTLFYDKTFSTAGWHYINCGTPVEDQETGARFKRKNFAIFIHDRSANAYVDYITTF